MFNIVKIVSDIYGLMQHTLYPILIGSHCNVTVTLAQHCNIKNGPLYGLSYLYVALLTSMTLCPYFLSVVNSYTDSVLDSYEEQEF